MWQQTYKYKHYIAIVGEYYITLFFKICFEIKLSLYRQSKSFFFHCLFEYVDVEVQDDFDVHWMCTTKCI